MNQTSAFVLSLFWLACEPVEVKTSTDFDDGFITESGSTVGGDNSGGSGGTGVGDDGGSGGSDGGNSAGDTAGGGGSELDICEDSPSRIRCEDGLSVECGEDGQVVDTRICGENEVCVDDSGCVTCTLDARAASDAPPHLRVRPRMSEANFMWERLHAIPMTIVLDDPAFLDAEVEVRRFGDTTSWWTPEGEALPDSLMLATEDLPFELLLHAHGLGRTNIEVTNKSCDEPSKSFVWESIVQPPITGHPVEDAPWFERVTVFNQDEAVWATLAAFRHGHLAGKTADVYLTEHRTPTEWSEDQRLDDVRLDGPNVITIDSDGGPSNQWLIGTDMTVIGETRHKELDIVVDTNRNGFLDIGDVSYGPADHQGGVHIMGDLAAPGPSDVESFTHETAYWLGQKVYYPTDIADRSPAPLIVISHGNGHQFTWYDYLGTHLASHGYVVMSHRNNTGPGIETASTTTLENTDHFFEQIDVLAEGALARHVDDSRIVWIGHSRGGEGVVRAYDRLIDEDYRTEHFNEDDIVLISSIAPTIFYTVRESDPHQVPYHLFAGAADGDVTGGPNIEQVQYFRLTSAAEGPTQVTYLHGVSHNDFNCCGMDDGTGPDLIGPEKTQRIAKAYYLALVRAYADGHTPSLDFFRRSADAFRPIGLGADVTIASEYRPDLASSVMVIDDFQSNWGEETASSGAEVTIRVDSFEEGKLDDANGNLSWGGGDPMNGMTQACCDGDRNRGAVFEWDTPSHISWTLPEDKQNVSAFAFVSVRAAQGTRNSNTVELNAGLDFSVSLMDTEGRTSTIWTGDLGQITVPYARTGLGRGAGWANEFNTVRIRLAAFQDGEPSLNLQQISSIRLDFGGEFGSAPGRLGIDDLLLEY